MKSESNFNGWLPPCRKIKEPLVRCTVSVGLPFHSLAFSSNPSNQTGSARAMISSTKPTSIIAIVTDKEPNPDRRNQPFVKRASGMHAIFIQALLGELHTISISTGKYPSKIKMKPETRSEVTNDASPRIAPVSILRKTLTLYTQA